MSLDRDMLGDVELTHMLLVKPFVTCAFVYITGANGSIFGLCCLVVVLCYTVLMLLSWLTFL